ncbi:hypothetical protein CB7_57 [Pectobacterium phage vB_PatM_CB7]|nr:hypothetical protein CB7_57 [Pectobacterium phage vB_PatM_CB7]
MHEYGYEYDGLHRKKAELEVGNKVKVTKDTCKEYPLSDNGWKVGDRGKIVMIIKDHPGYNIVVAKGGDRNNTLGFSKDELEVIGE